MSFARFQRNIVDDQGNIVPSCNIEVRREIPGQPLAVLYSDRDGTSGMSNPFITGLDGFAAFHTVGAPYYVRAYKGSFEKVWRFVPIGTGGEADQGTPFIGKGAWSAVITYAANDMVSHRDGDQVYAFVSNVAGNLNHEPPFSSGSVGSSDAFWTVLRLIEAPGVPGEDGAPGSSNVVGTSISSVAIGTGTKTFTVVEADRGWGVGARLRVSSDANPSINWMEGVVTSYLGTTLELSVDLTSGGGTFADWTINLAGEPGDLGIRIITAAGDVAVGVSDEIILMNKTAGAATNLNFPAAASYIGRGISIKDIKGDAQTNNLTPVFSGAETCDGSPGSDFVININYGDQGVFRPLPSGAGWYLHRR